jgi:hypothetical protein
MAARRLDFDLTAKSAENTKQRMTGKPFWSAVAEHSGDTAFASHETFQKRRAPKAFGVPAAVQDILLCALRVLCG